jgi:hypothetical protein
MFPYISPGDFTIGGSMTVKQIIKEMKHLSTAERLAIAEEALHLVHMDLEVTPGKKGEVDPQAQLATAAELLASDYKSDEELTGFTVLDGEDFYETR